MSIPVHVETELKYGIQHTTIGSVVYYQAHEQLLFPCLKCLHVLALSQPGEWESIQAFNRVHAVVHTQCVKCNEPITIVHGKVFHRVVWEGVNFDPPKPVMSEDQDLIDQAVKDMMKLYPNEPTANDRT